MPGFKSKTPGYWDTPEGRRRRLGHLLQAERKKYWRFLFTGSFYLWRRSARYIKYLKGQLKAGQ
ncbi:MAG: hypothetical protein HY982_03100 [Candidatus Magasanikbacteria bacterium]|nr:hypothetical protein [Candidatus Magasanikbacteria bacterium]